MESEEEDQGIGYIKYSGKLVDEGLLDARKSAQVLLAMDDFLRKYLYRQHPIFTQFEFEIPVRMKKGSWEAFIPHSISTWIMTALGIASTAYLTTAATKLAENDFKDASIKQLFKKAFAALQWLIKIVKHLKSFDRAKIDHLKWKDNNEIVQIPNDDGEYLEVPTEYLKIFLESSRESLEKIAELIEDERILIVGKLEDAHYEEVTVNKAEKSFFVTSENQDEILFPELEHGQKVELTGNTTKGNELTNSIGFKYKGHILNCHPVSGSIVEYKEALFVPCKITGVVDRLDKTGRFTDFKPRILFTDLKIQDDGTIKLL